MVMGVEGEENMGEKEGSFDWEGEDDEIEEDGVEAIRVVEQKIGGYDCPLFILSKAEEKRIQKPWKRGVIVKLLGRRIGYKALETRLKQMWVKKGIINIIDLTNDYYLVTFTHDQDHMMALMNGPWFIYDHYLTVKEWCPNFHPQSDTIKSVAVWVRISELPVEYYDCRVLHHIGNKIGKTVKVDKNTVMHARGKYARICVEIDLTKSLVAMFMIQNRSYKVEYEGLHLLCTNCGKFGHYKEGCPNKEETMDAQDRRNDDVAVTMQNATMENTCQKVTGNMGSEVQGPWVVVQKPRRTRKRKEKEGAGFSGGGKKKQTSINETGNNTPMAIMNIPKIGGSRFNALNGNLEELIEIDFAIKNNNEIGSTSNHEKETNDNTIGEKMERNNADIKGNMVNTDKHQTGRNISEDLA
ncbi:uncharacterized protein At4g02000-like [Vicia villosa]|uniref:uncharacterized protein At4g02000-like n=1 Tax=Vicia villosa TaxID=3911 RepID=UPI00273AE6EB|nr:uncharacterized protein At4g02000-like [Vicia villosa]